MLLKNVLMKLERKMPEQSHPGRVGGENGETTDMAKEGMGATWEHSCSKEQEITE